MAKNIYVVRLADGTTQEFTAKKAFKKLEGIVGVTVNGEDRTSEFVKEDANMAKEVINNEVTENPTVEAVEDVVVENLDEVTEEVVNQEATEDIETPETYLYVKAARDGSKLYWDVMEVEGFQMGMTFKEIEALIANPAHAGERNVIFVAMSRIKAYIEEGKQYGIKTTNKDLTKNYNKIMGTDYTVVDLTSQVYNEIISSVDVGITAGTWDAPVEDVADEGVETLEAADVVEFAEAV